MKNYIFSNEFWDEKFWDEKISQKVFVKFLSFCFKESIILLVNKMDSSTATSTLYSIFDFLKRDNITLSEVINYGTQFNSFNILPGNLDLSNEE